MTAPTPVVLCILDGWGNRADTRGNAPALAETPNFDQITRDCPTAQLVTHGKDVGLPTGQMGNSEVGHTNIGAGRIVAMDLGQIDLAIEDGRFAENDALMSFIEELKVTHGAAHLMGVVSDGGVHGHIDHILAAVDAITGMGVPVVLHAITDGRDVAPKSGAGFLKRLAAALPETARIGTVIGRYYAMDRDTRWDRVESAYRAMIEGKGEKGGDLPPAQIVEGYYDQGLTDEFLPATIVGDYAGVHDGDGIFCMNFRADRAREILRAIGDPDFSEFDVSGRPELAGLLGMVDYSTDHNAYMTTCYPKQDIVNTLGAWAAAKGLRQFRVAETEKYPHVTFFLNGGKEVPEKGEERYMAPSPRVATYDMQPQMSAAEVTDAFVGAIEKDYDLIVCNYANPDMVGHTGDLEAAKAACEAVDAGLGQVLAALDKSGGAMIVTADHGNCETMVDPDTGAPHTAHTTNPVPVILVGGPEGAGLRDGRLADLAPTLLDLLQIEAPSEMTGESLITR